MKNELPESWREARLDDICLPVSQCGPDKNRATFRYVDLGALDNKRKRIVEAKTVAIADAPSRARQIIRHGDVIFSTVRVYLENIAVIPEELDGEVASTAFCVLRPAEGVEPRFLYHFVTSKPFVRAVNELQRGNSPPSVQDGDVRSQAFPLAPLAEQRRIASRIDELFSRIEEGERALERVQKLVERYRQSVLKAAVTGELTHEWREKHKGKIESGEALLARILKARREAWETTERDKKKAKEKKQATEAWKRKYQEPLRPSIANKLPEGWTWSSVDQLTTKITSGSRDWKEYYGRGEGVFIMAQNVRSRRLDLSELQRVDPPDGDRDANRSEIQQHDLLATIVGANTGDVCRVREPLSKHYVCQSVALIRPVLPAIAPFVELFLCADEGGQAQFATSIYGAGRPHLSFDQLKAVCIPMPPLDEQIAICDAVIRIESDIEGMLDAAGDPKRSAGRLKQAVLHAAFTGALVRQDLTDEPAAALGLISSQQISGDSDRTGAQKKQQFA